MIFEYDEHEIVFDYDEPPTCEEAIEFACDQLKDKILDQVERESTETLEAVWDEFVSNVESKPEPQKAANQAIMAGAIHYCCLLGMNEIETIDADDVYMLMQVVKYRCQK